MTKTLKYLTIRGNDPKELGSLSLSPKTSDQVDNQVVLNALIATLVKYSQTGKIEPYLAQSWDVSEDGLEWTFNIKSGFSCEAGESISAELFVASLKRSFKGNIGKSDKTEFNKLEGWSKFIGGSEDLSGLSFNGSKLFFKFVSKPKDILNFLRMPYFGLWCNSETVKTDFDIAGFRSSGAYRLKQVINSHLFQLEIRADQPSYSSEAPQQVQVGTITPNDIIPELDPVIYKLIHDGIDMKMDQYHSMSSPPAIFQGIVLHPNTTFFGKVQNRRVFASRLSKFLIEQKDIKVSPGMYLDSQKVLPRANQDTFEKAPRPLRIAFQYKSPFNESNIFWRNMFSKVLHDVPFEIVYPDPADPMWVKNMLNNPDFDIRTAHVYAGTTYNLSTIKMMFCSDMGISFPDTNKNMCKLVEEYEKQGIDVDENFKKTFEINLEEDATLFPIYHANDQWLISKLILMESMPTSIIYPLFENIRFKP